MEYAIKKDLNYESIVFNSDAIQTQGVSNITLQTKIDNNEFVNYQMISKKNTVTKLDFPEDIDLKLISRNPFGYTIPGVSPKYQNKKKIEDFLYEIQYGNIDYDYAKEYFIDTNIGGCSSIRNGNWFGRNFDWLYNNDVQFIVHTPTSFNRYSVLGVSGIIPGITKNTVDNDNIIVEGVDMFKLLPFYLLDGINEKGLFCTHNVVPLDNEDEPTIRIPALKEELEVIAIPMLVRYILDNFCSAKQAIDYIKNYVTLYFTNKMIEDYKYQSHFLIGDSKNTYVVEFINNEIVIHDWKYITNFQITDVQFDENNFIQYPPTQFGINKYGKGLERWNIIALNYKDSSTLKGMRNLLDLVKYSNGYIWNENEFWYSEITGMLEDSEQSKITVDTPPTECTNAFSEVMVNWDYKDRDDPNVCITCHSSIYDICKKELYIKNQENETEYKFNL